MLYKDIIFSSNLYENIRYNMKRILFNIKNKKLVKIVIFSVDEDEKLYFFIQDSTSILYWLSNMRGTSKKFKNV